MNYKRMCPSKMAASMWPEIAVVGEENRRELVLHGPDISKKIDESGLDNALFDLTNLNLLEIFNTTLIELSSDVIQLKNLTSLVLHSNQLSKVPKEIGSLEKLKLLDLSQNKLSNLPDSFENLNCLETLNVSNNEIVELPDVFDGLVRLHILQISSNKLSSLPHSITSDKLEHLQKISARDNAINDIPHSINNLLVLKHLDMTNNALQEIPSELSECFKMKELYLGGNKLKDRRLMKLIDQCHAKSVLDYLSNIRKKEVEKDGSKGKGKKKGKKGKSKELEDGADELGKSIIKVLHFGSDGYIVKCSELALEVRPYILCCVVRGLDLQKSANMFKMFITLQNNLHDEICVKRQEATIATHDLKSVNYPLLYDAKPPSEVSLVQLFKQKASNADHLVKKLRSEAEAERKAKKRNTFSGIYKYLTLLNGLQKYAFLFDADGEVISFPPITNCEKTKVTLETTDILVEVTSTVNLDKCKTVMNLLLLGLLELGCGTLPSDETDVPVENDGNKLVVEQVRILNDEGHLKIVYPSRNDLTDDQYKVIRDYE